jgi:very-short-patch-repair endonuclease
MLKNLLNTSEYKSLEMIEKALKDSNYKVFPGLPLYEVFDNKNNEFSKEERKYIRDSTFDFVVVNEKSFPQLAIEFDGPVHDIYEKKRLSDIKKNRICMKQGLDLLRIRDFHLRKYEKITILEYILLRFIKWNIEYGKLVQDLHSFFEDLSEEEVADYTRDGILDPTIDPTVIFDLKYPFPGIEDIKKRMSNIYGICDRNIFSRGGETKIEEDGSITHIEYKLLETPIKMINSNAIQKINIIFSAPVNLLCFMPTEKDWNRSESPYDYFKKTGKLPAAFNDIPGLSADELAETLAEYFTIKKIENWLEKNAKKLKNNNYNNK